MLVTGDISFSGRREEYQRAGAFLTELASVVGLPKARFFFVPGNHDVDRSRNRLAFVGAYTELTSQPQVDRLLGSASDVFPLIDRQSEFRATGMAVKGDGLPARYE